MPSVPVQTRWLHLASLRAGARAVLAQLSPRAVVLALRTVGREDIWVARAALAFVLFQSAWIGWDLPGVIGWENDGVAPRDLFAGVAHNLLPGQGHRYPLFHNLALLIVLLPVLLACLLVAPLLGAGVATTVTSVPAMSAISLFVRMTHVLLGGTTLLLLARLARRLFGVWAGRGAVLCAGTSLTIVYYARASNLDGPYMFWTVLAADRLLSVVERGETLDYALLGVLVAASIATKDQAYAGYVLALPLYLVALPLLKPAFLASGSRHFSKLRATALAGVLSYGVLAGVVVNPRGLITRLALLTGPNSQDWRNYQHGLSGVLLNLRDLWLAQPEFFWPWAVVLLCWSGVLLTVLGQAPGKRSLGLLPLAFAVSSVVAFTLPVARCEHRFMLPLGLWLAVYGGVAMAWLEERARFAIPLGFVLVPCLAFSLVRCVGLGFTQWNDGRRDIAQALSRLPSGSVVEVYGFTVYQPQFELPPVAPYRVERIGKEPVEKRARVACFKEVVGRYGDVAARKPIAIVISEGFASRFLPHSFRAPEAPSNNWLESQADADGVRFFREALTRGIAGYRLSLRATPSLPAWLRWLGAEPVSIHDSTAHRLWLFIRRDALDRQLTDKAERRAADRT